MHMSRQAANYLIVQLEGMGYLERREPAGSKQRLVYLSARGLKVGEVIYACLRQLQSAWAKEVGYTEFKSFMDVLNRLSKDLQP
jgi:DNA-binding MarR family transcriptional regulator